MNLSWPEIITQAYLIISLTKHMLFNGFISVCRQTEMTLTCRGWNEFLKTSCCTCVTHVVHQASTDGY